MNQENQAHELMVQAQWFATAISIIIGVLMAIDTISTLLKIRERLGD